MSLLGDQREQLERSRAPGFNPPQTVLFSYKSLIDRRFVVPTKDTAKLSTKFQISIPKAIRTARRWQAGQVFAFIPKGEGMLLVPVPKLEELSGMARGAKPEGYRDRTDRV
jgi:AbrB family looped-hinge helix DNA binding protein